MDLFMGYCLSAFKLCVVCCKMPIKTVLNGGKWLPFKCGRSIHLCKSMDNCLKKYSGKGTDLSLKWVKVRKFWY